MYNCSISDTWGTDEYDGYIPVAQVDYNFVIIHAWDAIHFTIG